MHSMTGYGSFRREAAGREMTIELKAVNHRFLDVNLRLPRGLLFLEDSIRKMLSARLSRGHVDVFVTYRNAREDAREVSVDTGLAIAYATVLDKLAACVHLSDDRSLSQIAALPDVLTISEGAEDQPAVTSLCTEALEGAVCALVSMRLCEGKALADDIARRLETLLSLTRRIGERAPEVVRDYQSRLSLRIEELLASPADPQRLAMEVALMADRAAIDEELVRLVSHIAQMQGCLTLAEPVGRKLDFLVQELNREVNTIGSKASDLTITTLVVEAKAEIEKLREQVQNIE